MSSTFTAWMIPLASYPTTGTCVHCHTETLTRLVYEYTTNPDQPPNALLTPVVCETCGLRHA